MSGERWQLRYPASELSATVRGSLMVVILHVWEQRRAEANERTTEQGVLPEGIASDGNRFNRTAATAPLFNYLAPSESADERVVSRDGIEPSTRRLRVCCSAN
jgi:hypothetical protein